MAKYLDFRMTPRAEGRATDIYEIWNIDGRSFLGRISWYAPWRKYCFYPAGRNPVFDAGCLRELAEFMESLMANRKQQRANDSGA